jgi:hypothetical protein
MSRTVAAELDLSPLAPLKKPLSQKTERVNCWTHPSFVQQPQPQRGVTRPGA